MAFFRSEEMSLCSMLLHTESAFDCLAELGTLGVVQFNNLHDADHKPNMQFTDKVQRCKELQRIMQHMQTEIDECGLKTIYYSDVDSHIPQAKNLKEIEGVLLQLNEDLMDVETNYEALCRQNNLLKESYHVLNIVSEFLYAERKTKTVMAWSDSVVMALMRDGTKRIDSHDQHQRLGFFSGSIPIERFHSFELMLWRVCHGNFYMRHAEIEEPLEDLNRKHGPVRKFAFVIFFQGRSMRDKISKVCQGFHATLFECPESREMRAKRSNELGDDIEAMKYVLDETNVQRRRVLVIVAAELYVWRIKVKKMLMIYHVLNKLQVVEQLENGKYLQAECWIPTSEIANVKQALHRGTKRASKGDAGMMFPPILTELSNFDSTKKPPPTFFRLNRFTQGFQNLVDSYGVATYQELNPAPYTIITFPFLFAVMFGDIGHGLIMAIFGFWMVNKEKELEIKQQENVNQNEIWNLLFGGRYVIMLMGVFSVYTGLIYNDMFSKSFNIFGSHWRVSYNESTVHENKYLELDPALPEYYEGTPYIFGMDPVWDASGENAIITFNSLKMKLAIILGVTQMLFGLLLSTTNQMFFKSSADLYLVCFPQIIFLCCLFVYLVFLIFYKWSTFGGHYAEPYNSACAPSILIVFIDMILMKSSDKPPDGCLDTMYNGQNAMQYLLLFTALFCIPILLAGKPILYMLQSRQIEEVKDVEAQEEMRRNTLQSVRKSLVYQIEYENASSEEDVVKKETAEKPEVIKVNIGELWIHQGIHCIESVLGSVSHTASYLRLWALSLAHDQLSTVLWNMVLAKPLTLGMGWVDAIFLYLAFWFWAILTLAILVIMEGLSAFLHTLRLHWVEFQSKFYSGSGELFSPFRFPKSNASD